MRANWQQSYAWVRGIEGGYVDDPDDPGGETNHGVTHRVYDAYRERKGLARQSVRLITPAEVESIYRLQYWAPARADDLPPGVDYMVFDFAINSGVSRAVKELQKIVGVTVDGVMGEITLAAVRGFEPVGLIRAYCEARMTFLSGLYTWWKYENGWTRRVMGEEEGAQDRDSGVIDRATKLARGAQAIRAPKIIQDGAQAKARDADRIKTLLQRLVEGLAHVLRPA